MQSKKPRWKVANCWGHSFIPELIRPGGVAFDFGANCGGFSRAIASHCERVFAFEPDPTWRGRLELPSNVTLFEKAVAAKQGPIRLFINAATCSSLHYADDGHALAHVEAITLADALSLHPAGVIDLVKIDIEGEEASALEGAPDELLRRIAQLTVEFHDFLDPASLPAIRRVIARMEKLGFFVVKMSWRSYGDVLMLNRNLIAAPFVSRLHLRYARRYSAGLARMAKRAFGARAVRGSASDALSPLDRVDARGTKDDGLA